ncbi:hypothetical protein GCM10022231_29230 [Gordonia caeni]|uniref:Bacterial bifunctional deaminase-reductase C-terminal domain-containing protein n=1 Tax=Gordonia caeni TaxID=1007097 RepID=A0ABP7PIY3_9ACTN
MAPPRLLHLVVAIDHLVDELTLSHVPVLIGDGPSLFGPLGGDVHLEHVRTAILDGGMVQTTYRVLGGPTPE